MPPVVPSGPVKPRTCSKCGGDGTYSYARGGIGACSRCAGTGQVETDRAVLAARKARADAEASLYRAAAGHWKTAWAITRLREEEPERYEKALASHLNDHPGLLGALRDYYDEHNPPPLEREITGKWMTFEGQHPKIQDAIRERHGDGDGLEWQVAYVPTDVLRERLGDVEPVNPDDPPQPVFEAADGSFEPVDVARYANFVARGLERVAVIRSRPTT